MTTDLSLAAALAHPDHGGLTHVAGPVEAQWSRSRLQHSASFTHTARFTDELLILAEVFPAAPWQQDALVRTVFDRGFTGLCCPALSQADDGAKLLAERFGVTLLEAVDPFAFAKCCWQLEEARDSLTLSYISKVAHSMEYPARELRDLLGHFAANIGHPLALVDAGGPVVETREPLPPQLHRQIDFTQWLSIAEAGDQSAVSVRVDSPARTGLRLVVYGTGLGRRQLQSLGVVAEVMMPAVAARIMIDEHASVSDAANSAQLLRDFLEEQPLHDPHLAKQMEQRGWSLSGAHLGFHFAPRTSIELASLRRVITDALYSAGLEGARLTTIDQGVLGWLTFAEPPTSSELQDKLTVLRELLPAVRKQLDIALGVGSLQYGASGLASTINEATGASRIATSFSKSGYLVQAERYGLEELLTAWTNNDAFRPAAESLLAPLSEESPELVHTLAVYLDHGSLVQATAKAMGLHRNTVSARIHRAQQLLGIDLTSSRSSLALHLACRAVLEEL